MKKWFLVLVASVIAIVLAACNDSADPTDNSSKDNEIDLTAEEVYSRALETSEDMGSVEAAINMKQEISDAEDGTIIENTDSDINMQIILDPFAMHMKETSNMELEGIGGDIPAMDTEIYFVDDGMYIYNDYSGNDGDWMKKVGISEDMMEEMSGKHPDPNEQLKEIQKYANDLSIEQLNDEVILKLDADDEKFNDFVEKMVKDNLTEDVLAQLGEEVQTALQSMDVNSMSLEITLDKETFELKTYNMDMEMTMESGGEKNNIVQGMESEYSNVNNVDPIEVPEDIQDEAIAQ
ncbi:hypothetical protein J2Z83_003942 [Virgibacillus natechei]|uniref:Lipoprotein n=1 Tax=Virgibacillus natechei TaxID=1216297 RepID=A0ABS4ILF5_9BACI|nr:DUF6612 family protein [Virgibacillus natechei]MBP1971787.1 hypothetical protein [Virgibacillus natechei]UZD13780.1 hypothetical protein OLD84_04300 [Virgibacillus natechei]